MYNWEDFNTDKIYNGVYWVIVEEYNYDLNKKEFSDSFYHHVLARLDWDATKGGFNVEPVCKETGPFNFGTDTTWDILKISEVQRLSLSEIKRIINQ